MTEAGAPKGPGYEGDDQQDQRLLDEAGRIVRAEGDGESTAALAGARRERS